jgi:hypothetical protein
MQLSDPPVAIVAISDLERAFNAAKADKYDLHCGRVEGLLRCDYPR